MTDNDRSTDKTISVKQAKPAARATLGANIVRQSFSHGRVKSVVVEKKRRRVIIPGSPEAKAAEAAAKQAASEAAEAEAQRAAKATLQAKPKPEETKSAKPQTHGQLTEEEREARERALLGMKSWEDQRRSELEEIERRRLERETLEREENERRLKRQQEIEEHEKMAAQKANLANETTAASSDAAIAEPGEDTARGRVESKKHRAKDREIEVVLSDDIDERDGKKGAKRHRGGESAPAPARPRKETERRQGRLTVVNALAGDSEERGRSIASYRRKVERDRRKAKMEDVKSVKVSRDVVVPEMITIQELANRMAERAADVVRLLMKQGQMLKATEIIDGDMAQLIAEEMGHRVSRVAESDVEIGVIGGDDALEDLVPRPPVVTVMGHVDHGKTSLLDAIRKTNVVEGEAGGITQHIGAYQVNVKDQKVTFIDTPGHEAFSAMRSRGAKTTDIVVLVVAANDGVMPQTIEAINHAKAANVPMVVAINKIDAPGADPNRVRTMLLNHEIVTESMGGDVLDVEVSALKRTNIEKLLDTLLLQAEILELKANPARAAEGVIVEAKLDRGRGPVVTALVQRGTLRTGDIVVAGSEWGKVRMLQNDRGDTIMEATPSMPIEILGLSGTPDAGDQMASVDSEARAREVTLYRKRQKRELEIARLSKAKTSLESMMTTLRDSDRKEFQLVVKADVNGSLEAIIGALEKIGNEDIAVRVLHGGVGGINESDVTLASTTNSAIIAFNVRAERQAREAAERNGIEIRYYSIVYDLIDDVKKAMSGMLDPHMREVFIGYAEVLEVFNISKVGNVAGCRVTEGTVERGQHVRLLRDNVVIHQGKLSTLRRFKDEVKVVQVGQECGMGFERYHDIKVGDQIECYRLEAEQRVID